MEYFKLFPKDYNFDYNLILHLIFDKLTLFIFKIFLNFYTS